MMQEFDQILNSPKADTSNILQDIQNLIYSSCQKLFPQSFDFSQLQQIYCEVIGQSSFNLEEVPITIEKHTYLIYRVLEFFFKSFKTYFIPLETYQLLQEQTQKAQATIRSHIKIQHEMKMYLDYLQAKIQKYQKIIESSKDPNYDFRRQLNILMSKQNILQRQKINLLKKNEELKLNIERLNQYININSRQILIKDVKPKNQLQDKINQIVHKFDGKLKIDQIHKQNQIEKNIRESQINLRNAETRKQSELEYININHDYNNQLTQKKKAHFFK